MRKSTVLEKNNFECTFAFLIDLKCRCLQYGLAGLEKRQTFAVLLMVDFLCIFKITHF